MATNPTGINVAPQNTVTPVMSAPGAPTGSPGTYNFGNTANPTPPMPAQGTNPYGPTTGTATANPPSNSTFPMPAAGTPAQNPGGSPPATAGTTTTGNLAPTIGSGLAAPISSFLNSEGGYNSALTAQDVAAQTAAMQQQITQGANTLKTNEAESGISQNSSVAALENSNFQAQATTQENAITAQDYFNMWSQSQQQETSMLESLISPSAAHQQYTSAQNRTNEGIADFASFF